MYKVYVVLQSADPEHFRGKHCTKTPKATLIMEEGTLDSLDSFLWRRACRSWWLRWGTFPSYRSAGSSRFAQQNPAVYFVFLFCLLTCILQKKNSHLNTVTLWICLLKTASLLWNLKEKAVPTIAKITPLIKRVNIEIFQKQISLS